MTNEQSRILLEAKRIIFRAEAYKTSILSAPPIILELSDGSHFELSISESKNVEDEFTILIDKISRSAAAREYCKIVIIDNIIDVLKTTKLVLHGGLIEESLRAIEWRYGLNERIWIYASETHPLWFELQMS